jgi:hypothetical protein
VSRNLLQLRQFRNGKAGQRDPQVPSVPDAIFSVIMFGAALSLVYGHKNTRRDMREHVKRRVH